MNILNSSAKGKTAWTRKEVSRKRKLDRKAKRRAANLVASIPDLRNHPYNKRIAARKDAKKLEEWTLSMLSEAIF